MILSILCDSSIYLADDSHEMPSNVKPYFLWKKKKKEIKKKKVTCNFDQRFKPFSVADQNQYMCKLKIRAVWSVFNWNPYFQQWCVQIQRWKSPCQKLWPRGYKTFFMLSSSSGPDFIKLFSCSAQLSTKFSLLINMKMPTIVGIFIFTSRENFMLS